MCVSTIRIRNPNKTQGGFIDVPCGKCAECYKRKRREWLLRLEHEHYESTRSLFVTLTYDDDNIPVTKDGEMSFNKKHLQDYHKRLRKKCKFRYFLVSEYGSKTHRPHYHALYFNFEGNAQKIVDEWKYGHVHIGDVTSASINYCAAYVITKNEYQDEENERRPFCLSSRRPGIGANYVDRYAEYHRSRLDHGAYRRFTEGTPTSMPRYYKEKIYSKPQRDRLAKLAREMFDSENLQDRINEFNRRNGIVSGSSAFYKYQHQIRQESYKNLVKKLKQNRDGTNI